MFKIIFVLVINSYHGGINTDLQFRTLAQCESAKQQIQKEAGYKAGGGSLAATCLEMQVPNKKTKCKIINENYHVPHPGAHSGGGALENFPYPVSLECREE